MIEALCGVALLYLVGRWIMSLVDSGHDADVEKRRAFLIYRAQTCWPQLDLCAALDCLYTLTLREIKTEYAVGNDTDELQDDLVIIQNIRNQLLVEEDAGVVITAKY